MADCGEEDNVVTAGMDDVEACADEEVERLRRAKRDVGRSVRRWAMSARNFSRESTGALVGPDDDDDIAAVKTEQVREGKARLVENR